MRLSTHIWEIFFPIFPFSSWKLRHSYKVNIKTVEYWDFIHHSFTTVKPPIGSWSGWDTPGLVTVQTYWSWASVASPSKQILSFPSTKACSLQLQMQLKSQHRSMLTKYLLANWSYSDSVGRCKGFSCPLALMWFQYYRMLSFLWYKVISNKPFENFMYSSLCIKHCRISSFNPYDKTKAYYYPPF